MLVAVPRLVAGLIDGEQPPLGAPFWRDTAVPAPSGPWRDVLTGARRDGVGGRLAASDLFAALPIAVLRTISMKHRSDDTLLGDRFGSPVIPVAAQRRAGTHERRHRGKSGTLPARP